ncbi:MAG: hypothetical protein MJZ30_05590 [Paludibacteraceae bacterium]|nr:hypothetical protein [Paludibacteraceae bacterium]
MENGKDIYFAPMIIPTLSRSEHFVRLVESLKRNGWAKYTDIYISVDFPPADKYKKGWQEICDYLDHGDFSVFHAFHVSKQSVNLGCFENYDFLLNQVKDCYECWISSDDDVCFSPNFLEYMDKVLWHYRDNDKVLLVSGYSHPLPWRVKEGASCFRENFIVHTWGAGVWKSKQSIYLDYFQSGQFLKDAGKFVKEGKDKNMTETAFRNYFAAALSLGDQTRLFRMDSDVAMTAYVSCKEAYCVLPVLSKVRNFGFDGTGEYCPNITQFGQHSGDYNYTLQPIDEATTFEFIPDESEESLRQNFLLENEFDNDFSPESQMKLELARHNYQMIKRYGRGLAMFFHLFDFVARKLRKL